MRRAVALTFTLLSALFFSSTFAQTVSMSGSMGDKALLVINGTPRTVAVGATQVDRKSVV